MAISSGQLGHFFGVHDFHASLSVPSPVTTSSHIVVTAAEGNPSTPPPPSYEHSGSAAFLQSTVCRSSRIMRCNIYISGSTRSYHYHVIVTTMYDVASCYYHRFSFPCLWSRTLHRALQVQRPSLTWSVRPH